MAYNTLDTWAMKVHQAFGTKKRLLLNAELSRQDGNVSTLDIQQICLKQWQHEVTISQCEDLIYLWKMANNK